MPQLTLLFTFLVSAVLTAFVIPKIILISYKKKLFDFADERKVHKGIVPRLGGVASTLVAIIVQDLKDLNLGTSRRTAMVTIFFVSAFFVLFNPGLMYFSILTAFSCWMWCSSIAGMYGCQIRKNNQIIISTNI